MTTYDCALPDERSRGLDRAVAAAGRHQLVVFPTESVYAVACDAFSSIAVERLNEAKGRVADEAVPVMVGSVRAARALVDALHPQGEALIEGFWPGPLTVVCPVQRTLHWDIGGDGKFVALRMPLHPLALTVLQRVGPMAVVSANRIGEPAPHSCTAAKEQLGTSVSVYLNGGERPPEAPSTVLDLTEKEPRLLRQGAYPAEVLRTVAPDLRNAAE